MTEVSGSYFYDNGGLPVIVNQYTDFDTTNHFYDPSIADEMDLSSVSRAGIQFSGDIDRSVTFNVSEVPYVIAASDTLYINETGSLTVSPGAIVKMGTESKIWVFSYINAPGTDTAPILFTSLNNSDEGGDTSGAGGSGTRGSWYWIDLMGAGSSFSHCEFSFAVNAVTFNWWDSGNTGAADFDGCRFHDNSENGIYGERPVQEPPLLIHISGTIPCFP